MANHSEEKKPIYKKWWFWVIIVVVILAIGGGASTQNNNNQQVSTAPATQTETQTETTSAPTETTTSDKVEVTLAQYEQVKDGMTYDEVVAIFGGKESSSSESEIMDTKSEIKTWNGKKLLSVATIGFTNGKVSSKSQTGLE